MDNAEQRQSWTAPSPDMRRDLSIALVLLRDTLTELWKDEPERRTGTGDNGRTRKTTG